MSADAEASAVADSEFRWYIVQVMVRCEKKVAESIEERARTEGVAAMIKDIKVPSEDILELKSGQKRKVERLLFPGYVLVHMQMNSEAWGLIRRTPHVRGFLGERHKPVPLSEEEIKNILARTAVKAGEEIKTETIFEPGEVVRIIEGPFADFSGTVEEVNAAKSSLRVTISIFGRMTPTEVSFKQVVRDWA